MKSNLPQNLTLAEIERWSYIENLPTKEMLDLHIKVFEIGTLELKEEYDNGYDRGYDEGYNDGYDNALMERDGVK